ncbi:MAG: tetratricopeptide repeat protein [Chloroflexota bacterium]|nr:tetratricopeptide repeat protein [Chloroflexota bacterium]
MSDILNPKRSDEDDFESLFEAFGEKEVEEAPKPPKKKRGNLLDSIKTRRASRKKPAPEPDAPAAPLPPAEDLPPLSEPQLVDVTRDEFLAGLEAAQVEAQPPSEKQRRRSGKFLGLSRGQLAILAFLVVLVGVAYVALGWAVLSNKPSAPVVTLIPEETPLVSTEPLTPEATTENVEPTPTPTPTPTATPFPVVATRLDLQILQTPNDIELRLQRGAEYLRLRAYDAARSDFEYAVALDKTRPEARLGLGQAYFYLRRWEEAESELGMAISFDKTLEAAHFWRGTMLYYEGRYEESAAEFDWAAELNPDRPKNEAWLALAAAQGRNLEEALGAVGRAQALDDQPPVVYLAQAQVNVLQEDYEAAQGNLLHAQDLAPHDFDVLNALANFYADYVPERVVEAEHLIQQAQNWAEWDIQQAQALHTLGRIYLAQGRKEDAASILTQAADLAMVDGRVGLPSLVEDMDRALAP